MMQQHNQQCGNCYYHLGDYHEALENYSRAIELYVPPWRPPVPPALLPLATYYRGRAQCLLALKVALALLSLRALLCSSLFAARAAAAGDVLSRPGAVLACAEGRLSSFSFFCFSLYLLFLSFSCLSREPRGSPCSKLVPLAWLVSSANRSALNARFLRYHVSRLT